MKTVTLCMIVKDEEATLARAVAPFSGAVEEIVIADTGSRDRTKEIASSFSAEVFDFPWVDDFSAARNAVFARSHGDYNLWLDADDVIDEKNLQAFLALKNRLTGEVGAYFFRYETAFDSRGNPTFWYYRERLIRNTPEFRFSGAVHEAISCRGRVEYTPVAIRHQPQKQKKPGRNLQIYRKMLREGRPFTARDTYYFGRELLENGKEAEARRTLTAFLSLPDAWTENKIEALVLLSDLAARQGDLTLAYRRLCETFRLSPPRPEVCYALGNLLFSEKNYLAAADWYRRSLTAKSGMLGFRDKTRGGISAALQLVVCYDRLGDRKRAYAYHKESERLDPEHPSVVYNRAYFAENPPYVPPKKLL